MWLLWWCFSFDIKAIVMLTTQKQKENEKKKDEDLSEWDEASDLWTDEI